MNSNENGCQNAICRCVIARPANFASGDIHQWVPAMPPLAREAIPSFPAYGLTAPPVDLATLPEANRQRALVMRKMREIAEASGND